MIIRTGRVQDKVQSTDFIKEHLMQLLSSKAEGMKERIAVCLAHLLTDGDLARAYSCYGGGEVLLDLVCSVDGALEVGEGGAPTEWENAVAALKVVVEHCGERESAASVSCGPPPPQNKVRRRPAPVVLLRESHKSASRAACTRWRTGRGRACSRRCRRARRCQCRGST